MALNDIFSRASQKLAGVFAADSAQMQFASVSPSGGGGGGGGVAGDNFKVGMITQNVGIQYQQMINRLYEVGSNNTYMVGGRTQGNLSIGRVIGPVAVADAFYKTYGNMCNAMFNQIDLSLGTGCQTFGGGGAEDANQTSSAKYSCVYVVIVNLGMTVAAENMIFNEQLAMMFISLELGTGVAGE